MSDLIDAVFDIQSEFHREDYAPNTVCIFTHSDTVYHAEDLTYQSSQPDYTDIAARVNGCAIFTNPEIPRNAVIGFHPVAAIYRDEPVRYKKLVSKEDNTDGR